MKHITPDNALLVGCAIGHLVTRKAWAYALILGLGFIPVVRSEAAELRINRNTELSAADTAYEGADLIVDQCTLTLSGAHAFHSLKLVNKATLTHPPATAATAFSLDLVVATVLQVDPTSLIDVSGRGYLTGRTVANSSEGAATDKAGGSYGGIGGKGYYFGTANRVYGDYQDPKELGAGGGEGGVGGGSVQITADTLMLDGSIQANGTGGGLNLSGGSGGGIRVQVSTLTGQGSITASGGPGTLDAGSGGGGRIAIYYGAAGSFDWTKTTAFGGPVGHSGLGGAGTVYLKSANGPGRLLIDNGGGTDKRGLTPLGLSSDRLFQADQVVMAGSNVVVWAEHLMPLEMNQLSLVRGAWLTHQSTTDREEYSLALTVKSNLWIDADSKIDVTGRGYWPGRTRGNVTEGAASGNAGGSYGGIGGAGYYFGTGNDVYGDYRNPNELGSGGAVGGNGGGLVRVLAGVVNLEGAIIADGSAGGANIPGGSGGGILLSVDSLVGAGRLSASGGGGTLDAGSGGGGRIAVYYTATNGFALTNINVSGGWVGHSSPGQTGSIYFGTSPYFVWDKPATDRLVHDTIPLHWSALGCGARSIQASLMAYRDGVAYPIALTQAGQDSAYWDTSLFPDGRYELKAIFEDTFSRQILADIPRQMAINNSAVWHSGVISSNQTWAADTVHVVEDLITIQANATLALAPGAIVKFFPNAAFRILKGGLLTSAATSSAPTVMTSLADDTVGGDTNLDGDHSKPMPGDWAGITVESGGTFITNEFTDLRYMRIPHSGKLVANETWLGTYMHQITGDVVVPLGTTLTIQPGAVVKFNAGLGMTIQSGGRLIAPGTVALPIRFTSIKDDAAGGDSNGDGSATVPGAGDWRGIVVSGGAAVLDHVELFYGGKDPGGSWEPTSAPIAVNNSGTVTLSNSVIRDAFFDGIINWGSGTITATSTLIADCDRGLDPDGSSVTRLINCTLDNNRIGIWGHNGTVQITNTIISHSMEVGIYNVGNSPITMRSSDVWSSKGVNYQGNIGDQTGQNGNISADPKYKNAAAGNYRLDYGSPCVDAADGTVASATDFIGAPRYSDPRTIIKTGVATATGAYADMGAFEFVENAASDVDLIGTLVNGPTVVTAGDNATVQWTVANIGTGQAIGPWHDTIYLSSMPVGGPAPLWAGEVLVGQGVVLGAGQTYTASATVRVPGGTEGRYQWQVHVNNRGEIFEGINWTNNLGSAAAMVDLRVPELGIGASPLAGHINRTDEPQWFKIRPAAGQDVLVILNAEASNVLELYLGRGYMPTRQNFDVRQETADGVNATGLALGGDAQTYYILVYPRVLASGGAASFTISAKALDFSLTEIRSAKRVGNAGPVTFRIRGGKLRETLTYQMVGPNGQPFSATSVYAVNASEVYATFDLSGRSTGTYSLSVQDGGRTMSLNNAVEVFAGTPGNIQVSLSAPRNVRPFREQSLVVEYRNAGGTDVLAPLMLVSAPNASLRFPDQSKELGKSVWLLGINREGPAGTLPPGGRGSIELLFKADDTAQCNFSVQMPPSPNHPADWISIKNSLRPEDVSAEAWNAIYANFVARMGSTMGQYQRILAEDATYLGQLGQSISEVQALLAFELFRAGQSGAINQRYQLGAFGRGQFDPTDLAAVSNAQGDVRIRVSGSFARLFKKQPNGGYVGLPGDYGILAMVNGLYQIREKDGSLWAFRADGKLDFVDDLNQNRVNWGYTNGRLISWTDSWGNSIQLSYNASGRVIGLTDPVGRVTTFVYDASEEHLIAIIAPDGATNSYTYITGQGANREHAAASITFADGTQLFFEYDGEGGLKRISRGVSGETLTLAADSPAGITLTDAQGGVTKLRYNHLNQLIEFIDPLNHLTKMGYNAQGNLTQIVLPGGLHSSLDYDNRGNLVAGVDPLGQRVDITYDPVFNLPLSLRSPGGQETQFAYDARGNPRSMTYPDNRTEQVNVDAKGQIVKVVNARGHETQLSYNDKGLLTRKQYADGSTVDLNYDAHRNLARVIQFNGVNNRTNTYAYDASDRLTRVTDPFNRSLEFTYNIAGRRIRMTTSDGFTVNYAYNVQGRLSQLTDASGRTNVVYTYDASGRLARKQFGNGMLSAYEYDAAGQLIHLENRAPDQSMLSRFEYTYDTLGRSTRLVTLQGTNDYSYDAAGHLTAVALPGGRTIQYAYDAEGNRRTVTDNGAVTAYLANRLNQYLAVGATAYQFDADGNLIAKTQNEKTSTFSYDDENKLVQVTTPEGTWRFEYDGLGNRIAQIQNGDRTEYLTDPSGLGSLVGEYSAGSGNPAHYAHGLGLAFRQNAAQALAFYAFDASGNTSELTDSNGSVLNRYGYLPFGETQFAIETLANPFQFVGQWGVMRETCGIDYMRARYYQSGLGRFLSRDPLEMADGLNLYAYAQNDPVGMIDATGTVAYETLVARAMGIMIDEYGMSFAQANMLARGGMLHGFGLDAFVVAHEPGSIAQLASKATPILIALAIWETSRQGIGAYGEYLGTGRWEQALDLEQYASRVGALKAMLLVKQAEQEGRPRFGSVYHEGPGDYYRDLSVAMGEVIYPSSWCYAASYWTDSLFDWTDGWLFGIPPSAQLVSRVVRSLDPNDITGPAGYGEQSYIMVDFTMYYLIRFENKSNALAGAQMVMVTNQLASTLDFTSFELGNIGFGTNVISVPTGRQNYSTRVDVRNTLGLYVDVKGEFNPTNGMVLWTFRSIDPVTGGEPDDPFAGFLPPNTNAPAGEGWVRYSVRPRTNSNDGSQIQAMASIVFDTNPRIDTPTITNAVDSVTPASQVNPLPATSPRTFTVSWKGQDGLGAGVAYYSLFVSTNQGPFGVWLSNTTNTSAAFTGVIGNTYAFYSLATDGVGYWEQPPAGPDAFTRVEDQTPVATTSIQPGPEMTVARMGHYITELPDGRVVVFGGHGNGFVSLNSIEIWRPETNLFSLVSAPHTFDWGALARLADGRYLMAGGSANLGVAPGYNTAQIFDPASSTVTATGTTMTWRRTACRGALLANGKVLIVGGWYDNNSAAYGEIYDPAKGTFAATGALRTPRALPIVLPTTDGKAVIAGGSGVYGSPSFLETVELYDPGQNAFTALAATVFAGEAGWALRTDLDRPIEDFQTADGRYVFLASRTTNNLTEVVLALFDPATRQFTRRAMRPAFTEKLSVWPAIMASDGNAVYFLSGYNTNNAANLFFCIQRVDLATGERVTSDELSITNYYPGSAAMTLLKNGRLLVTGGTSRVDARYNFEPVKSTFWVTGLPAGTAAPSTPTLTWSRKGDRLILAWPIEAADFNLEYSAALSPGAIWIPAIESVQMVGSEKQVTLKPLDNQRFFRLRKP